MENINYLGISRSIESIRRSLQDASRYSLGNHYNIPVDQVNNYIEIIEFNIEKAYSKALVLLELLGLKKTYCQTRKLYKKAEKAGFAQEELAEYDMEPFLVWRSPLESILDSIADYYNLTQEETKVSRGPSINIRDVYV